MTVITSNDGGRMPEPETASTWMQGPANIVTVTGAPMATRVVGASTNDGRRPVDLVIAIELLKRSLLQGDTGPRYSPVDRLGAGTQGVVWRVADHDCRRELAFKLLATATASAEDIARFVKEAQITAQLEHPGIPPVHDIGRLSDGTLYYSMKCVEGMHLADHLSTRAGHEEHRFALLQIFLSVCQTVAFAHSKGVIHRDLKPKNVMVGRYGEVLLMDWGLAKLIGADEDSSAVRSDRMPLPDDAYQTMHGTAVGTPAYMSPEQAVGGTAGLDRRCDVYSLGVILYEMLAAESPYQRGDVERVMRQCRDGDWTRLDRRRPHGTEVPRALVAIVHRAMAVSRDHRYQTVEALADDLRAYLVGAPVSAHPDGAVTTLVHRAKRHRSAVRAGLIAATASIAVIGGAWWLSSRHESATAAQLRVLAEQEEASGRLDEALATVQRLQGLRPGDAWAAANQVRLRAELKHRAEDEARHQTTLRGVEQNRRDVDALVARARAAAAQGDEAGLARAAGDYLAALAKSDDDQAIRLAYETTRDRLAAVRVAVGTARQHEADAASADAHLASALRASKRATQDDEQAAQRRAEAARLRLRDPADGRIAELDDAAMQAERSVASQEADAADELDAALRLSPDHREARRAMADWCGRALRRAEATGDEAQTALLAVRAKRWDDEGRYREVIDGLGRMAVPVGAPAVSAQALRAGADQVLRPTGDPIVIAAGGEAVLTAGHWLVRGPGGASAVRLERGARVDVRLAVPSDLPTGMVAVVDGAIRDQRGAVVLTVPPFALAQREVTCGEYLVFLNDPATQAEMGAAAAAGRTVRLPRGADRLALWARIPDGFVLQAADGTIIPAGRPVTGISLADAEAFARWRSAREGRAWRLPTRLEWRAAAQSGDGRPFPWGLAFAPGLVLDAGQTLALGGSHAADATPAGVLDLAGSVAEWTASTPDARAAWACGGSFRDLRPDSFCDASVRPLPLDAVDETVGFRLALSLPR